MSVLIILVSHDALSFWSWLFTILSGFHHVLSSVSWQTKCSCSVIMAQKWSDFSTEGQPKAVRQCILFTSVEQILWVNLITRWLAPGLITFLFSCQWSCPKALLMSRAGPLKVLWAKANWLHKFKDDMLSLSHWLACCQLRSLFSGLHCHHDNHETGSHLCKQLTGDSLCVCRIQQGGKRDFLDAAMFKEWRPGSVFAVGPACPGRRTHMECFSPAALGRTPHARSFLLLCNRGCRMSRDDARTWQGRKKMPCFDICSSIVFINKLAN